MFKYVKSSIAKYIIFLFTIGVFSDIGNIFALGNGGIHLYLVVSLLWGVRLLHRYGFNEKRKGVLLCFLLYISYFIFVSIVIHGDNIFLVTSQTLKYVVPIVTFFVADSFVKKSKGQGVVLLHKVINDVIVAQILFCIVKLAVLGAAQEGLVGSLSGLSGGGAGTSFPMLALLWLAFVTNMRFSRKFWLYNIGFLFIGFMTAKRAIWILYPAEFIILFLYYRAKDIVSLAKYIVPAIIIGLFFLYIGLRLSPTLNPDKKVWGRFDLEYAYNYAVKYSGGSETVEGEQTVEEGDGRIGAVLLFWNSVTDVFNYDKQVLLGYGNERIKYYDKRGYSDRDANFGVSYRGGITGIVFMYFISGVVGVILFLIFLWQMFTQSRKNRVVWIAFGVVMFDFIFYNGQMIINIPMVSLLFLVILTYRIGVCGQISLNK